MSLDRRIGATLSCERPSRLTDRGGIRCGVREWLKLRSPDHAKRYWDGRSLLHGPVTAKIAGSATDGPVDRLPQEIGMSAVAGVLVD